MMKTVTRNDVSYVPASCAKRGGRSPSVGLPAPLRRIVAAKATAAVAAIATVASVAAIAGVAAMAAVAMAVVSRSRVRRSGGGANSNQQA
jgi:hypothetical protein